MNSILAVVLLFFVSAPTYQTECSNKYPVWQVCKTSKGGGTEKAIIPPAGTPGTPNPPGGDDGGSEGGPGNGNGHGHGHGDHGHSHDKK